MRNASWNVAAPRAACFALAVLGAWQILGGPAAADEVLPAPEPVAPESVVVVQPGVTQGTPRLLYQLDGGQMSVSEMRPGTMETAQLQVYVSTLPVAIDVQAVLADPSQVMLAMLQQESGATALDANIQTASAMEYSSEIMPRSYLAEDGTWVFPRVPGVDEREILSLRKWRVEENPESQMLFLGPDRRFGWDDFADLINPLQHVPLVNIAYRAITGDEIYGAARLLDAGFGPAAGVTAVADLAFTSTNGEGLEETAVAALFGPQDTAPENLAWVPAPGEAEQLADSRWSRRGSNQ